MATLSESSRSDSPGSERGAPLDPVAFRAFYERNVDALFAFAARRIGRDDAEDVVADVFVTAFRSMPAALLDDDAQARPWLFRVVRNRLISRARHDAVVQRRAPLLVSPAASPSAHDQGADELWEALAQLPERQRLALELRFVEDLDVPSVAALLDVTEEAARALTHRALKQLRQQLGT